MSNGQLLMQCLVVVYVIVAVVFAWEGNWWKVVYWCSASALTISVLNMK